MAAALRLLLLADDPRLAHKIERDLRRTSDRVQITAVDSDDALRQALKRGPFDLGLIDYPLAWTDSHAALRALRQRHPDRAIVLLVAAGDEAVALRALDIGDVDGYAVKTASGFDRLTAAARAALALARRRQALSDLEAHVRGLFDTAPIGLYRATPDGTILEVNDALIRMMGYPDRRAALAVQTPDLYVNPEERARWRATVDREGAVRGFEMQLRRFDGSTIWVDFNAQATRDAAGRILYYEGSITDISERKRTEAALRESEERYRTLAEAARDFIYILDRDGGLTYVNTHGAAALGASPEALRGRSQASLFPPAVADRHARRLAQVVQSGEPLETESHDTLDGRDVWLHTSLVPIKNAAGDVRAVLGISRDITARKRAEDALRESQEFLDGVMNSVPDAIFTVRMPDRVIEYVNRTVGEIFGYAPDELVGRDTRLIYPDESAFLAFGEKLRQVLAHGHTRLRTEQTFQRKSGQAFPAELHGTFVHVSGQPVRLISIIRDTTERKALEAQVRDSQKLEAIGRLAGGVAHDFNNVLTAVLGYATLLIEELKDNPRLRADVEEIRRAGERAAALTQQLLAFGRRQLVQPAVVDLNATIRDLEDTLRRLVGDDVELRIRLASDLCLIRIDPRQLHQLLLSLTTNAHDAMPTGGRFTIETASAQLDAAAVRDRPGLAPGRYVSLAVTDTGPGMDADTLAHAFEPFFTTRNSSKGTGLNLATAYAVVKQSGGDVDVRSAPNQGTTFTVYLPCVSQAAEDEAADVAGAADASVKSTVLVAEDEDAVRALARQMLMREGYTVLTASSGEQALRTAERHAGTIDLLLTDVIMPGMNGPELAERLVAARPGTKVLFMSGHAGDALDEFGLRRETVPFLPKPFTPEVLVRRVREIITR